MRKMCLALAAAALAACTSVTVRPVDQSLGIKHVCIRENPDVKVDDFMTVVRDGLDRHGISSEVFRGTTPANCEVLLTYTARRRWDLASYMTHAELRLEKGSFGIGYAEYHLNGGGGFALNKWAGTRSKMDPVIDELLAGYK